MSELRALEIFSKIPTGCILRPISNDDSDPHLRAGEFAVIDTNDTEPQIGELYLIKWIGGRTDIVQAFARQHYHADQGDFTGWWTRCLRHVSFDQALAEAKRRGGIPEISAACYVDGPRLRETFQQALMGRVVGIDQSVEALPPQMKQVGGR